MLDVARSAPMLEQTIAWSNINSGSHNLIGLATLADLLADAFAALPGDIALMEALPENGMDPARFGQVIQLSVRPDAPRRILLTGHMDTVYGAEHPFQSVSQIDDQGIIGGPGVADMKGGLAVMLAALRAFETCAEAAQLGYDVILNPDEEIGSTGSAAIIAGAARGKHVALTYEPAQSPEGMFASARPGSGNFALHISGRAAHAGRNPQDGRNAIVAAADLAMRFAAMRRPGLSVNPARIEGGGPNNVVPDHAVLHVNLRPQMPQDLADAEHDMNVAIAEVMHTHDVHIHSHGSFGRPPKPVDSGTQNLFRLVRACGDELGLSLDWQPSGGVCDGNNIAACGVPVIDTMGVRGGAIHSEQEYLIVESLAERAQLSALLMLRLAQGR